MSKVIRISDDIFARLQVHGTPLVDTPATVIEKLLDYYEKKDTATRLNKDPHSKRLATGKTEGLYLAPANLENMKATVIGSKSIRLAEENLSTEDFAYLEEILGGKRFFHCWAMTKNSRSKYTPMRPGDKVLFTIKGTGRFSYIARVIGKLESALLGNALWDVKGKLPWELIYFLDDVREINVPKEKLLGALGYDQGFVVPGITRASDERVYRAIHEHGNIAALIHHLES